MTMYVCEFLNVVKAYICRRLHEWILFACVPIFLNCVHPDMG